MLEYDSSAPNGWGFANRYLNFNEDTILPPICWEDCIECLQTTWDCDGQGNCFDPGDGSGQFTTFSQCESICFVETWDCDPLNGCISVNDGSGAYGDSLSCVVDCQILSVTELPNNIHIYPNPSLGNFKVESESKVNRIIVYNKIGEQVLSLDNKNSFDLTSYKSGVYYIAISLDKQEIRSKVIKY